MTIAQRPAAAAPLQPAEFERLLRWSAKLPPRWTSTPRRRRLLFLALAAPGFAAIFATPLHRNLAVLAVGFLLFAAACGFRRRTEPLFARAERAALWPPTPPPPPKDVPNA
jgi:hypothetical protein